jgi:hypothetical protein
MHAMNTYCGRTFKSMYDRGGGVHEGMSFRDCLFDNCGLALDFSLAQRSVVRDVHLTNCTNFNSQIGPAVFDEVTVDGLKSNDILILWGPSFRHVVLKGKILGQLKINETSTLRGEARDEEAFAQARAAFYKDVDWALDISEAHFGGEFDMRGVPAKLVRRDPKTQVVVTRGKAVKKAWRTKIAAWNTWWPFVIDLFLSDGDPDVVLVANRSGRREKTFKRLVEGLDDLRRAGVAEPD